MLVGGNSSAVLNPLNAELNPICHLLALLGAHHILHISRIRVNVQYYLGALVPVSLLSVCYLHSSLYNFMVFCVCEDENVIS